MPHPARFLAARIVWMGVAGFGGATVLGLLGQVHWFFDLFAHFPLQVGAGLALLALAALVLGRWRPAVAAAGFLVPNLFALSYYYPARDFPAGVPALRVVCFNVLTSNNRFDGVRAYLETSEADFILLLETNRAWISALAPLETRYPYTLTAPREDNFGMALYSRHPIESHQFHTVEGSRVPCLRAVVSVNGEHVEVMGGHPVPPVGAQRSGSRNAYLETVAQLTLESERPTVVLGDFNSTVWSPHFREFLATTNLHDTGRGRGFQATWQRGNPLFSLPIDHILHSAHLLCTGREVGPALGSDHRPVVAELAFR